MAMEIRIEPKIVTKTSLIVNYLPPEVSDEEFRSIFLSLGPLKSTKVVRDKATGMSYGFGFVEYEIEADATRAVKCFDGLRLQNKKIKVSHANVNDDSSKTNVYIRNLPKDYTDKELNECCREYGKIIQSTVLVDLHTRASRCVGFVLFESQEQADKAIDGLNGKVPAGGTQPLYLKYADDHAKKGVKQGKPKLPQVQYSSGQSSVGNFQNSHPMNQPMQNSLLSQVADAFTVPPPNMMNNSRQTGNMQTGSMQGGPMRSSNMNRFRFNPMSVGVSNGAGKSMGSMSHNMGSMSHSMGSMSHGGGGDHMPVGPPYAIFVLNIGTDAEDQELWALFSPFGAVSKVAVTYTANKTSKGYGFVEMSNLQEAKFAIEQLNGSTYKGKTLSVSFKKK